MSDEPNVQEIERPDLEATAEFPPVSDGNSNGPSGGTGLASRMASRAEYLEKHQTGWFGVPGFDDVVEVELRAQGYKTMRKIQRRNERVRVEEIRELYTIADMLLNATVGFREVSEPHAESGEVTYADLPDESWQTLAKKRPGCPEDPSPRQAILYLVGDSRLPFLAREYEVWASEVRQDVDQEVVRDFDKTPSRT